ncbi:type III polyketide synthase [soil metagenome]
MKSYISAIGTATPEYTTPQLEIADFMATSLQMDEKEKRRLQALYRASGIKYRSSVLKDYSSTPGQYQFYSNTENFEPIPSVSQRMDLFKTEALKLGIIAVSQIFDEFSDFDKTKITHLITVSCTGFYAPGLDIELIEAMDLPKNIQRSAINFMGCYAAFNAIKLGDALCKADNKARVLIVCVELCSIHFQKLKDEDNLLANTLFGDGAAALLMTTQPSKGLNLFLENFYCDLAFEGKQEMAWQIGNYGFEMKLSSYVPDIIKSGIRQLTEKLLKNLHLSLEDIDKFAIHPGGKKILETIEKELGMSREDNKYAYQVLRDHGNMSSATIIFVIKALCKDLTEEDNHKRILSFAFGPGLTLESMVTQVIWIK